ncbi:glycoside hydrolase family 15 protein, partial [Russula compacta]
IVPLIPDPEHPEYTVYWLRDACRVYHAWLNELTVPGPHGGGDGDAPLLRSLVDDSVHALIRTQQVVSLAGNVFTGGLEEAVFDVHLGKITNPAARPGSPAADGPPFRAAVLIKYAEWLLGPEQDNGTWVADVLWPAVNLDLQWVSSHWNQSSWDLWWPPVWCGSYWTASLQYRALRAGARLGTSVILVVPDIYAETSRSSSQTFWNEEEGYMSETTVTDVKKGGRSGKGTAPLAVSVLNFDPSLGCDPATFQPCSDRALSSLKVIGDAFKEIFPIASRLPPDQPNALLGPFLEEEVFGGHAQHFGTLHAAEQAFDALTTWHRLGELQVTDVSLKFFRQFDAKVETGAYAAGSETYDGLTRAITTWAERALLLLAEHHTPRDHVLSMSIHRATGAPVGARGLLPSLVAALGVYDAYDGLVPPSWAHGGASGAAAVDHDRTVWIGPGAQFPVGFKVE